MRVDAGSVIVILCLIIAAGASIGTITLAARNSFSSALLQGIYPIAGAALASLYFLVKMIVVDAPTPRRTTTSVGILQEKKSGMLYTMSGIWTGDGFSLSPLFEIDAGANIPGTLTQLKSETAGKPNGKSTKLDLLEYAIVKWLMQVAQLFGYRSDGTLEGFSGSGGGGGFDPKETADIPILTAGEANPYLANATVRLPVGSSIVRRHISGQLVRELEIRTQHSALHIRFPVGAHGESLDKTVSPVAKKVIHRLKLKPFQSSLWLDVFRIEMTLSQVKFTRFSRQAVRELDWMNKLGDSFQRDFSWVDMKKRIAAAPELPE